MMSEESRIGVYICHCGGNISDAVDVGKVKEATALFKGVKVAETYLYARQFRISVHHSLNLWWF